MTIADVARLTEIARSDGAMAARALIGQLAPGDRWLIEKLLDVALWSERDIRSFDECKPVLIEGRWGRYWFAPVRDLALEQTAPVITPRGLKALAKGIVDLLARTA